MSSNVNDLNQALADISDIRAQIAAARLFRGFGPMVIGLSGVLAFLVTGLQLANPGKFAAGTTAILLVWVCVAGLALLFIAAEMFALSRRHHGGMAIKMVRMVVEGFLPALLAGAVLGLALIWRAPELAHLLPPLWQYMIAIGLFSAMGSLHRNIYLVAIWYFICATATLVLLTGGQALSPWHMGVPFGAGQLLMAAVLHFSFRRSGEVT